MEPAWQPALLGSPAGHGRVRCGLCPFGCSLGEGQAGPCRVRRNRRGALETATFTASVAHLDAIERKPFYHLRPGAKVLTIAGPGCTFSCGYCINHRLSQYGRDESVPWTGTRPAPGGAGRPGAGRGCDDRAVVLQPGLAPELTRHSPIMGCRSCGRPTDTSLRPPSTWLLRRCSA